MTFSHLNDPGRVWNKISAAVIGRFPWYLIFCESVIDMMSYYQLHQKQLSDVRLISMEGLKLSVIAYQTFRLAAEEQGNWHF